MSQPGPSDINLLMSVFFCFRSLLQASPNNHHSQAVGCPQECLQQFAQAGPPCPGTTKPRHGAGHEGRPGLVPESTGQGEAAEEGRQQRTDRISQATLSVQPKSYL